MFTGIFFAQPPLHRHLFATFSCSLKIRVLTRGTYTVKLETGNQLKTDKGTHMTEPILKRKTEAKRNVRAAWLVRLLLAVCLFFGSEVFMWTDIARPVWMLALGAVGYILIAALLLDLWVRFKVREIFGALVLAGFYGLCAGFFVNPASTLNALPTSLITRVMGAQVIAGALGIGLFIVLLDGIRQRRLFLGLSVVAGFFGGAWARGYPTVIEATVVPLVPTITAAVTVGVLLIGVYSVALRATDVTDSSLRLMHVEWGGILGGLAVLLIIWLVMGAISRAAVSAIVTLLFYCVMTLWFQDQPQAKNSLAQRLPASAPPNLALLTAGLVIFVGVGALSYQIPPPATGEPGVLAVQLIFVGTLGLVWLPAVSMILGIRAYRQTVRTGKSL
jgi:hypothetical protein